MLQGQEAASLDAEVQGSFDAYASLWKSRTEMLLKVSRVVASMSDVRSAFRTGDRATISDTAGELWSRISDTAGIFLVTDPRGGVIASLGGAVPALGNDLDLVAATQVLENHPTPGRVPHAFTDDAVEDPHRRTIPSGWKAAPPS